MQSATSPITLRKLLVFTFYGAYSQIIDTLVWVECQCLDGKQQLGSIVVDILCDGCLAPRNSMILGGETTSRARYSPWNEVSLRSVFPTSTDVGWMPDLTDCDCRLVVTGLHLQSPTSPRMLMPLPVSSRGVLITAACTPQNMTPQTISCLTRRVLVFGRL